MAGTGGPSTKRFGDYHILAKVGRGGMGTVFKAREPALNRVVAIKLLERNLARDEIYVKRFLREARAMAGLSHPNVVAVHSAGHAEGRYYIAMEFVDGKTVARAIEDSGGLELAQALDITRQAADALAEVHEKGIIHRDIKPQNLMIDISGQVKVMDFGLARSDDAQTQLTADGATLGTPRYMSPEQCGGHEVDARTDIYSLGVSLYEMLANRPAYSGDSALALMYNITHQPFPDISKVRSDLPKGVAKLIGRMTAREAQSRYASADLVAKDCANLAAGKSLAKKYRDESSGGIRPRLVPKMLRSRFVWAGVAFVAVLGGLAWGYLNLESPIAEFEDGPYPVREVRFPEEYSLGSLGTIGWDEFYSGATTELGEARGIVSVPANQQLLLRVNLKGGRDLSWLDGLEITDLQGIGFQDAEIVVGDLVHLERLAALRMLSLRGLAITDAEMRHLRRLREMRQLDVSNNRITDAGLENIAHMTKMTVLNLFNTGVTDKGMAHLAGMTKLNTLIVDQVNVDYLSVDRSEAPVRLTNAGLLHLEGMVELKHLRLSGTHITDDGVEYLTRFESLERLELNAMKFLTPAALKSVAKLEKLRHLNVHNLSTTRNGLQELTGLQELRWLALPPTSIAKSIESLKKIKSLKILDLAQGKAPTLDWLEELKKLEQLKILDIQHTGLDDNAVEILKEMGHLKELALSGNSISDTKMKKLREALPGVKIHVNQYVTDAKVWLSDE